MTLNAPELVATLARLHDAYEEALAANDVPALTAFFWDSPNVIRYGLGEQLYGADSLHAYRAGHTPRFSARRILRREITVFGNDFATIMSEIEVLIDGTPRPNRQSQTWTHFPSIGWRIVAAHVSAPLVPPTSPWEAYAGHAANAVGLPLDPAHRPGVAANLQRTAGIVAALLAFKLPDETEPAPIFTA